MSQTLYKASAVCGATQEYPPLESSSRAFDDTVLLSLKPIAPDSATYAALRLHCGSDLITNQPDCVLSVLVSMFKCHSILQRCACINTLSAGFMEPKTPTTTSRPRHVLMRLIGPEFDILKLGYLGFAQGVGWGPRTFSSWLCTI